MLKLAPEWLGDIPSNDPGDLRPFLLPGVRVCFAPVGKKAARAGGEAVRDILVADEGAVVAASDAIGESLLRHGIVAWEGVGDADGNPLPVNSETVEAFIANADAYGAADQAYITPWIMRDREKNASAGSLPGTGAVETPAKDTARSPATPKPKAGASPPRKRARKAART
jgi:hypothetical protein